MIGWVFQVTVISLCFIAVVHYLYIFFKTTLTVPKVKDLVNRPQQQYEELFKGITNTSIIHESSSASSGSNYLPTTATTNISSLPSLLDNGNYPPTIPSQGPQNNVYSAAMKDELKQFLKKLNRT